MLESVLIQDLCEVVRKEVLRKQREFNCFITLFMSTDPSAGCEMQVVYLNGTLGERKKISNSTCSADVARGVIRYFK